MSDRTHGGLGVGLSLVRSLVQMHGGSVEARSEGPGKGSEFIVRLPLADAPQISRTESDLLPSNGKPAHPRRILVVEDNQDQAQSLGTLLSLLGHEVHIIYDGARAVAAMRDFQPDIALIDIGLPGINGYEVARRIREHPEFQHVTLIAQTGWGSDDDRRRSVEAGFNDHLVKPVEPSAIARIMAGK